MIYTWVVNLDGPGGSSALLKAATVGIKISKRHYRGNTATLQ